MLYFVSATGPQVAPYLHKLCHVSRKINVSGHFVAATRCVCERSMTESVVAEVEELPEFTHFADSAEVFIFFFLYCVFIVSRVE